MPFKSGNTLGGRKKGSKSSKTKQWEQLGEHLTTTGATRFLKELDKLEGAEYLNIYVKLLSFFKPKIKQVEAAVGDDYKPPVISIIKTYDRDGIEDKDSGYEIRNEFRIPNNNRD